MKLISIGFGNAVAAARILAVVSPDSAPIKRVVQEARGARDAARRLVRAQNEVRSAHGHRPCDPLVRHARDDLRAYGRKIIGGDEFAAMKGKLFAISGPSGVGKNSVLNRVMQLRDRVQYSVSATSRPMRPGEIDGKSYYFVTREQFEQMIAAGELLEHAEYVGNYYGTPLKPIQAALAAGTDVVMDVDVVGALNIKKRLPEAVLVFMAAPSMAEIRRRLASRGDVSPELMEKRMDRQNGNTARPDNTIISSSTIRSSTRRRSCLRS